MRHHPLPPLLSAAIDLDVGAPAVGESNRVAVDDDDVDGEVDSRNRRLSDGDSLVCAYEATTSARRPDCHAPISDTTDSFRCFDPADIRMGSRIGIGNFGEVFHALLYRSTDVAVKRLFVPSQKQTSQALESFMEEVQMLGRLQHPNIIQLMGIVRPPELALVTEWMDLGSVHDLLYSSNARSLNWPRVLGMMRDACRGLNYLHQLRPPVIHRDVKPANLLVNHNFLVKVADFGISRVESLTQTMTAIGTAQWMAPEIIRNNSFNTSADVYSFGICLWEMCTRTAPFAGCNPMQVVFKVNAGERPPLSDLIPAPLAGLMCACWHEDPNQRPSFEDVLQALSTLAPDDPWPPYPIPQ
jgi:serine/threonine protein kinase